MVRIATHRCIPPLNDHRPKLIREAADYAAGHDDATPPLELVKLWDWRDLSTPPRLGGLDDQPAGFLRRARYLDAVYTVTQRWYQDGSKDFTQSEIDLWHLVLKIRKQYASQR